MAPKIDGKTKAAVLLIALGPEAASKVLRYMDEQEIEQLTTGLANLGEIDKDVQRQVLEEFNRYVGSDEMMVAGFDYAKELLTKALGEKRASELLKGVRGLGGSKGAFSMLRQVDNQQLIKVLQNEHPQTVAVVLSHLDTDQAAEILKALPEEMQTDVALRMATMDQIAPDVIEEIEAALARQITSFMRRDFKVAGGVKLVAEVLNNVDKNTQKAILSYLQETDPELAEDIKRLMFTFDDIVLIDDRSMQRVVKEIDSKELALALKGASEEVKEKFFKSMSERAADMIREEMEYMGPVRLRDVEAAQQRILDVISRLEEEGAIIILGRGEDEIIV